jgi:hypothetical protein
MEDATESVMTRTAHLRDMERHMEFNRVVLDFLADIPSR